MKKIMLITALILLIGVLFFLFLTKSKQTKYKSPDGNYTLIVTNKRNIFTMSMPGGGGSGSAIVSVKLLDKNNKILATTESEPEFSVSLENIKVEWDLDNNEVNYALARAINLKTGEFLY